MSSADTRQSSPTCDLNDCDRLIVELHRYFNRRMIGDVAHEEEYDFCSFQCLMDAVNE